MKPQSLLINLVKQYPFRIVLNIILGFSGAIFNGVSTALIVPVLLSILGQEAIIGNSPPIIQAILSPFQSLPDDVKLFAMAGAIIFCIILKNITVYITTLSTNALNRTMTSQLQSQGVKLLLDVDMCFFDQMKSGDLMNRLSGEVVKAVSMIRAFINLITIIITILIFLSLLLLISWQLTLATTLFLPVSSLISQGLIKNSKVLGKRLTLINQEYSGGLIELFNGIKLVKALGNEKFEYTKFKELIQQREITDFKMQMNTSAFAPINEVSNILVLFSLVLLGRVIFANQLESLSTILLTYLVILNRLLPYIGQFNAARAQIARSSASLQIVFDLLRTDNKPMMANGSIEFNSLKTAIEFRNVTFAYPGYQQPALKEVYLTLKRGQTLALVGSSGAGKSTLADLLPRFYDPTSGTITIDNIDLRHYDLTSLRKAMGIVGQDTFLFNDSIRNNICYGSPHKTDEEIILALKQAHAYDFVMQLADGLDTQIGDRGVMLSGGQRQRLSIARALLQNPNILILDEATSALDTVSERLVQQALDELSRERTVLVIAHRLSTVRKANVIAVLEKGQVIELGNHETLLQQNGAYAELYKMQFQDSKEPTTKMTWTRQNSFKQFSYDLRTYLTSMIGSLSLIADGLAVTSQEQFEASNEAYESALELLRKLEIIELKQKDKARSSSILY